MNDIKITDISGEDYPPGVKKLEYTSSYGDGFRDWALFMPGRDSKRWVTYLHGSLSHGDQVFTRKDVHNEIIPRVLSNGCSLLSPNLRNTPRMSPSAVFDLHELIEFMRSEFDLEYNMLNGGSMGGTGGLIYCMRQPGDVQKAFIMGACPDIIEYYKFISQQERPIFKELLNYMIEAYGGTLEEIPDVYESHCVMYHCERLKDMPIYFAHGGADPMLPVEHAREFALKMKGSKDFHYFEIPDGNHDSPLYHVPGYRFLYGC